MPAAASWLPARGGALDPLIALGSEYGGADGVRTFRTADVQCAARCIARRPLHSLLMVGTMSLAIGATTAIFSVLDAVLLDPLPVKDLDGVVALNADGLLTTSFTSESELGRKSAESAPNQPTPR